MRASVIGLSFLFPTVFLFGCAGSPQDLAGTSWQWVSHSSADGTFQIEQPTRYQLIFAADGTVNLRADCNQATGDYVLDGERLGIRVGTSTMALCPPPSRSDQFLDLLARADTHRVREDDLTVTLNDGSRMVFSPLGEMAAAELGTQTEGPAVNTEETRSSELLGTWEWTSFQSMDDTSFEVDDPSLYKLEFRPDGVSVLADCNRGRGGFESQSSSLRFTELATTRMACPPESLSDRYLRYLDYVRGWIMENGHLYLSLMADGGIMEFRPADHGG
jgi:heat shock protein HslJ